MYCFMTRRLALYEHRSRHTPMGPDGPPRSRHMNIVRDGYVTAGTAIQRPREDRRSLRRHSATPRTRLGLARHPAGRTMRKCTETPRSMDHLRGVWSECSLAMRVSERNAIASALSSQLLVTQTFRPTACAASRVGLSCAALSARQVWTCRRPLGGVWAAPG